ncbi:MAG TPA: hypothetical protein DCF94_04905 [Gammaproteobacteria bacterium]|nr:hypothetical protein [Gammaproteobacteria bacterium]|tara:strand:+ start:525 stop:761 length:237 start_codon:yes stop_codon:yes gene_type:complete
MNAIFDVTDGDKIVESLRFTHAEFRNLERALLFTSMAKGACDAPELPVIHKELSALIDRINKTESGQLTLPRKTEPSV